MRSFNLAEAVNEIPAPLEELLVRGAYMEQSVIELERSRQEQVLRIRAIKESRPPFLFLRPRDTRAAFWEERKDSSADLDVIERALQVSRRLCVHLRSCSEELLEKWLRTHCDEYRTGLAAVHFVVDWEESLARFTGHARMFIKALGSARNMATAGYDHARCLYSPAAYEAIRLAHAAALTVEADIGATNAIADEHDRLVGHTVFNDPMPRLVPEPYAAVVAQIAALPAVSAQLEFDRVIVAVEDLIQRELGALRERVRVSAGDHADRTRSYVRDAWNQLHAHAMAHSVEREHLGMVVAQTERAYLAHAPLAMV